MQMNLARRCVLIGLLSVSCVAPNPVRATPSASPRATIAQRVATAPSSLTPTVRPHLKVGSKVTYTDGWTLTLQAFGEQEPFRYSKPRAGMRFVVVTVRFDNAGQQGVTVYPTEFKMQDASGIRRDQSYCFTECRGDALPFSVELGPGGSVAGTIIFEVPSGDARLAFVDDRLFYNEVTWDLFP